MAEGDEVDIDYTDMSKDEVEERLHEIIRGVVATTRSPIDTSAEELLKMSEIVFGEEGGLEGSGFIGGLSPEDLAAPLSAAERMQKAAPRKENRLYIDGEDIFAVIYPEGDDLMRVIVWNKVHDNPSNPFFHYRDGELGGIYEPGDNPEMAVKQPQPIGEILVNGVEFIGGLEEGVGDEDFAWRLGMD